MKEYKFDPSLNILYKEHHNLDYIFNPRSIAVIGATEKENSVGRTLFENLINSDFKGEIFAVNPKRDLVLNHKSYSSIHDIKKPIDLVVIITPSNTVPQIISDCAKANVYGAIIISAGFGELGEKGKLLEKEILRNKKSMRIIGPNCLGVMIPNLNFNATFAAKPARKGNIAFISQSGALGTAVLDWSLKEKIGFSAFVSIGSMIDVNWGDLINYFGNDPNTQSILIYMESISDPRSFLSAAREVGLTKPIILMKAGKTKESAKAAKSHTGALAGSDEVLNAALKRVGVLRVDHIEDLFGMAEVFSKQPIPKGPNLGIITNAGGPAVIATDELILTGGSLASLNETTFKELNEFLPSAWSHNNPIDILGDASADLYYKTMKAVSKDPNIDGILVILTPQFMSDPMGVANKIKEFNDIGKPVLASWMGGDTVEEGIKILSDANIPVFEYPDFACRSFAYMWAYSNNLKGIYETPKIYDEIENEAEIAKKDKIFKEIIARARKENRLILDEYDSKLILQTFGIPIVETQTAKNERQAAEIAKKMGFPIVLKLFSRKVTHKSDIGGVKLNLNSEEDVKSAFISIKQNYEKIYNDNSFEGVSVQSMIKDNGIELILGSSVDEKFGPTILFGHGGELVEIFKDKAIDFPPLNATLASNLILRTKIYEALKGFRNKKAVNIENLIRILINFSNFIARYPEIKECDINPFLASEKRIIALDARIILQENDNYPKLAFRPYPEHYVKDTKLKDQTGVIIRPVKPEDEPLVRAFYEEVSENSLKQRYLKALHYNELIAHERLIRICYIDYDREITLIAELKNQKNKKEILAISRFTKMLNSNDATFALLVKDKWQNKGIGRKLLENIIQVSKNEHVNYLYSQMFEDNETMKSLCQSLNFQLEKREKHPILIAKLKIN
ncbi:MAG: GNAT family N-acetyltransferase [Parachlamydiales bacterium]|jgi:acetyltransferase